MDKKKYTVSDPQKLKSWEAIAKAEIKRFLTDSNYQNEVIETTMINEYLGPFTKFLYHFASLCQCGWGVMIDFNERSQKVFLPDHYYKWMHKLRDEVTQELEANTVDNKSVVTITLQEFAEKHLDGLYNPNLPDTMQCSGWYNLKNMVERQITPTEHNTQGFHPLLRDILIKNWNRIKTLIIMTPTAKDFKPFIGSA